MNEEIIIDGVNVAECEYAANTIPVDCKNNTCFCYEDENCYFKQFKRLQEENKKLKEVTNEAIIEHENLLINRNDFAERAEKYRQALEKIKKTILDHKSKEWNCFNDMDAKLEKISEILDEVLNDD